MLKMINIWRKYKYHLLYLLLLFIVLIGIYIFLLYLAYKVPNDRIAAKLTDSFETIASEKKRWLVLTGFEASKLDTFTDDYIYKKMLNSQELPALKAAMWNEGYVRYWLGDIAILRPLLLFFSYKSIRYFNIFMIFGIFYGALDQIKQRFNLFYALIYAFTWSLVHFWIFPLSLQYTPVFVLANLGLIILLKYGPSSKNLSLFILYLFLIIGSLTNYFDLLSAPLLTYGLPAIVLLSWLARQESKHLYQLKVLVISGFAWLFGYGVTWLAKWSLGSYILKQNLFENALRQAEIRTGALTNSSETPWSYGEIVKQQLKILLPKEALLLLLILGLGLLILSLLYGIKLKKISRQWPLILLSSLPFIWTFLLQNHGQYHYYFTYRIFIIPILALYFAGLNSLNFRQNQLKKSTLL